MRKATTIYKALSDPNRLRILMMLKDKPLCVCEIVDILQLANSTVSKHLSILRNANLIVDEKSGRWVNYSIAKDSEDIGFVLRHLKTQLHDDIQVAHDQEMLRVVDRHVICAPSSSVEKST